MSFEEKWVGTLAPNRQAEFRADCVEYENLLLRKLMGKSPALRAFAEVLAQEMGAELISELKARNRALTLARDQNNTKILKLRDEVFALRGHVKPAALAQLFHETYEGLAPAYGYETREDSAVSWDKLKPNHRALMEATAEAVLRHMREHVA